MLAHPLENETIDLADYATEWKWEGIRVQLVHVGGETRGYSRGGDEISASFPALQQRLGRKTVSKAMLAEAAAFVRRYDLLILGGDDLRELP